MTRLNQKGQVLIEYILMLIVLISIAIIITGGLIGKNPSEPGAVIRAWSAIINVIALDLPDVVN